MDEPDDDICLALATLHGAEFSLYSSGGFTLWEAFWLGNRRRTFNAATKERAARLYCRHHGLFA